MIADTLDKKLAIAEPSVDDSKTSALEPPLIVAFRGTHEMRKWFGNLSVVKRDSFTGKLSAGFLQKAATLPTSLFLEQVR